MSTDNKKLDRREFLKRSTLTAAALTTGVQANAIYASAGKTHGCSKKVIVIGVDGMDPGLSEKMMDAGLLPNFDRLRKLGGYRKLGTSIPPQSPVAWANFINGAGPGSHGIFGFIHRNPENQCLPFFSAAETVAGKGYWQVGDHKLQLAFWPFNHKPTATVLRRHGVPFWHYLDKAGIRSVFYDLPSNYPASESEYGNHKCLSGMGTPDMLGTYGTYQHFAEDGPYRMQEEGGGMRSMIFFENDTSDPPLELVGPTNNLLKKPQASTIKFIVHRDRKSKVAIVEICGHRLMLKEGQWSKWVKLDFEMKMPVFMPDKDISGICRFYLQEFEPNFRLYVSPINADPSEPSIKLSEPSEFVENISRSLGLFYTTGFQEDHKALSNKVFSDAEFSRQADIVLEERLNLLDYALKNYDDGLLFFYFSSTDMQAHMFWWDSEAKHPTRSKSDAEKYFGKIKKVYRQMDNVLGDILASYGDDALVIVISDHGFANFKRQFNLNTWLRENGYIRGSAATSIMRDVDWSRTKAYGLGMNGLYLNLKGRERYGIVDPGRERNEIIDELVAKLEAVRDVDGRRVIRKVHQTDKAYAGTATEFAPDLIVGYCRGYRASWDTCLGDMGSEILFDNDSAWSADHCADVSEVPGVVFCNRPITAQGPALVDIAPSILTEFGLAVPRSMEGNNIFKT